MITNFERRPVFLPYDEIETLARSHRNNQIIGKCFDSLWLQLPAAAFAAIGTAAVAALVTGSVRISFAAAAAAGVSMLIVPTMLSSRFEDKADDAQDTIEKNQRLKHDWGIFQIQMEHEIKLNVAQSAAARTAHEKAQDKSYTIPLVDRSTISPAVRAHIRDLDKILPSQLPTKMTRETWKNYHRIERVKRDAARHILFRKRQNQIPQHLVSEGSDRIISLLQELRSKLRHG